MSGPRRPRLVPRAAALLALALAFAPGAAQACAVCGGGNPANRVAFFASTVALSVLPLGMFVGGFLWLRSRLKRRSADDFTERPPVPPAASAGTPSRSVSPRPPTG